MESAPKKRLNRLGVEVAAIYVTLVVVVYAWTAYTTKPDNLGYDWIPLILLAMPLTAVRQDLLIPGVILNTVILYVLGTMFRGAGATSSEK